MTVKYCWIIYLKNIVRNPIVASRFHHCVGVQLPAFDILFVLNIAIRQGDWARCGDSKILLDYIFVKYG